MGEHTHYCLDLGGSTIDMVKISQCFPLPKILKCKSLESQRFISPQNQQKQKNLPQIIEAFGITQEIISQKKLKITGGHTLSFPENFLLNGTVIQLEKISEFEAIAKGGCFLAQKNSGLIISLGTGTAMVSAEDISQDKWSHAGGTGIGGGTFLGLGKATLGIEKFSELQKISEIGNLKNIDISVGEIIGGSLGRLTPDMTASNFGKFSPEKSTKEDIALGIANLIGQSIASLAAEKTKVYKHTTLILGGKISRLSIVVECIKKTAKLFDIQIKVPENSEFMTAIGGAIAQTKQNIKT